MSVYRSEDGGRSWFAPGTPGTWLRPRRDRRRSFYGLTAGQIYVTAISMLARAVIAPPTTDARSTPR
jgi:hypothetical protein